MEKERKERKTGIFEAKFSCRVNWMMNEGRCMLNRIPLAKRCASVPTAMPM